MPILILIVLSYHTGTQIDMALKEGDVILTKMIDLAIDAEKKEAANNTLTTAEDLLQKMKVGNAQGIVKWRFEGVIVENERGIVQKLKEGI